MAQYKGASVDGFRAKTLLKKREKQKEEIEHLKMKITEVNSNYYTLWIYVYRIFSFGASKYLSLLFIAYCWTSLRCRYVKLFIEECYF